MASKNTSKRLQKLSDSNFEIADNQPDIRGWDVKDSSGKKLGKVAELIFDTQAQKVRYLVLDTTVNDRELDDRELIIPIGLAELHDKDDDVILRDVSREQLAALPEYDADNLNTNIEGAVHQVFSSTGSTRSETTRTNVAPVDNNFYSHEHFTNNLYRNRPPAGTTEEYIRMRQEPSFLESEGTTHREIDDDIDEMREASINLEERNAVPVSDSTTVCAGSDTQGHIPSPWKGAPTLL